MFRRSCFMVLLLRWDFSLHRAENVRSEVTDATGNAKYNLNSLWTTLRNVSVTLKTFVEYFANDRNGSKCERAKPP